MLHKHHYTLLFLLSIVLSIYATSNGSDQPNGCEAGTFRPLTGHNECFDCPMGTYSAANAAACTACTQNTYSDTVRSTECKVCDGNRYISEKSLYGNIACANCPDGHTCESGEIKPCDEGKLCLAASSPVELPSGHIAVMGGAESVACPDELISDGVNCLPCQEGTEPGGGNTCQACPKHTHSAFLGGYCVSDKGYFKNEDDEIKPCLEGFDCPGNNLLIPCDGSSYKVESGCALCEAGSYVTPDKSTGMTVNIACTACEPGTYQPLTGQTSCLACPKGSVQPGNGSTTCTPCIAPNYANDVEQACMEVEDGNYIGECTSDGCTEVLVCPAGYFCTSNVLTACPGGEYSDEGASVCTPCGDNTVSVFASASTKCVTCPPGTVPNENHTVCTMCADGEYADLVSHSCETCPTGTVSSVSKDLCIALPGWYMDGDGQPALCERGFACPGVFRRKCPYGSFSLSDGSAHCTLCGPGSALEVTDDGLAVGCNLCPAGTYSMFVGSTECVACPPGSVSDEGSSRCSKCTGDQFTIDASGQTTCSTCPENSYIERATVNGNVGCTKCKPGFNCNGTAGGRHPAHYFCDAKNLVPDRPIGGSKCATCEDGFGPNKDRTLCLPCTDNSVSSDVTGNLCESCPSNTHADAARTSCVADDGYALDDGKEPQRCPPGTACANGEKVVCEGQTFAPDTATRTCSACPAGAFVIVNDSGRHVGCSPCQIGTAGNGISQCKKCAPGYFARSIGLEECEKCPEGMVAETKGMAACHGCPAGKVASADQTACIPAEKCADGARVGDDGECICPSTREYYNTDMRNCKPCPAGKSCDGTSNYEACAADAVAPVGSGSCTTCIDGYAPDEAHSVCEKQFPDCGSDAELDTTRGICVCSVTTRQFVPASTSCELCPAGHQCDGTTRIVLCSEIGPNTAAVSGQGMCTDCTDDLAPNAAQTECVEQESVCGASATWDYELGACVCSDKLTRFADKQCVQCPCGFSCDGSEGVTACPYDMVAAFGAGACEICRPGFIVADDQCSCLDPPTPPPGVDCGEEAFWLPYDAVQTIDTGDEFVIATGECVCFNEKTFFEDLSSQKNCASCPAGKFCDGTSKPKRCPADTYAVAGSGKCSKCPTGTTPSALQDCCLGVAVCPGETTWDESVSACRCEDHDATFDENGVCITCPCGMQCDGTADTVQCEDGTVSPGGNEKCSHCSKGYIPTEDHCACVESPCGHGAELVDGVCTCHDSEMLYDGSKCVECGCGGVCDGTSVKEPCPSGQYSSDGLSCSPCEDGLVPSEDMCSCVEFVFTCLDGAALDVETNECVCSDKANVYDANKGCQPCPCGHVCDGSSQTTPCEKNDFSLLGMNKCTACADDLFASDDHCVCLQDNGCPVGTAPLGSECVCNDATKYLFNNLCEPCPPGYSCDGSSNFFRCPEGMFSHGGLCTRCLEGQYPTADQSECDKISCPDGTVFDASLGCVCRDSTTYLEGAACVKCPCGYSCEGSQLTACDGNFWSGAGYAECLECPEGTFATDDHCKCTVTTPTCAESAVWDHHRSDCVCEDRLEYIDLAMGKCTKCPAGFTCDGTTVVTPCPEVFWAEEDMGMCSRCPDGMMPTDEGDGCTEIPIDVCAGEATWTVENGGCACAAGYMYTEAGCMPCPCGNKCDGSAVAQPCEGNFWASTGSSACERCPDGTMTDYHHCECMNEITCNDGAELVPINGILTCVCPLKTQYFDGSQGCRQCPTGYECDGSHIIKQCDAGYYADGGVCTKCPDGETSIVDFSTCEAAPMDCGEDAEWDETLSTCRCADHAQYLVLEMVESELESEAQYELKCVSCPCGGTCDGTAVHHLCGPYEYMNDTVTECTSCPVGSISTGCGCDEDYTPDCGEFATYNTDLGLCQCNEDGMYFESSGTKCKPCLCGHRCDGTSVMVMCEKMWSPEGYSGCKTCDGELVKTKCACMPAGTAPCGAGARFVNEDDEHGECICHSVHRYYDNDTHKCASCPCGKKCNGTSTQEDCPDGYFAFAEDGECTQCLEGQVSSVDHCSCVAEDGLTCGKEATFVDALQTCQCPDPKTYFDFETKTCLPAPCGLVTDGTSNFTTCEPLEYSPVGESDCRRCPDGLYPSPDMCGCQEFPRPTECTGAAIYNKVHETCVCVEPGMAIEEENNACKPCLCGHRCNGTGESDKCSPNTWSPKGVSECFECPDGEVSRDRCACMPAGVSCAPDSKYDGELEQCVCYSEHRYYTPRKCEACPCGHSCDGTATPTLCPTGYFAELEDASCTKCIDGTTNSADHCTCIPIPECADGTTFDYELGVCRCNIETQLYNADKKTCEPCPCGYACDGTATTVQCEVGFFASAGDGFCTTCPSGQTNTEKHCGCELIPKCVEFSTFDYELGVCRCNIETKLYNVDKETCEPCPCGYACDGTATTVQCEVGFFASAGDGFCTKCPINQTSDDKFCGCKDSEEYIEGCGEEALWVGELSTCRCNNSIRQFISDSKTCEPCPCGHTCDGTAELTPCPESSPVSLLGASQCTRCKGKQVPDSKHCKCLCGKHKCGEGAEFEHERGCICIDTTKMYDTTDNQCVDCPCGETCNGSAQTTPCDTGYAPTGSSTCIECPEGSAPSADSCQCISKSSEISAASCSHGSSFEPGVGCVCDDHKLVYLPTLPSTCGICPAGRSCDGTASTTVCPPRTIAAEGDGVCRACPAGLVPNNARTACLELDDCGEMASFEEGECICDDLSAMFFADTRECFACIGGFSCDGSAYPEVCPANSVASPGDGVCTECESGMIPNTELTFCVSNVCGPAAGLVDDECVCTDTSRMFIGASKMCVACPAGVTCDGKAVTTPCPVNHVSPIGSNECNACPSGQQPNAGQTACVSPGGVSTVGRTLGAAAAIATGLLLV